MSVSTQESLTASERRVAGSLAAIYAVRMLGLFLILPVFSLWAVGLEGATPFLVGLAVGAYGLTQGLLQIPLGMLSDRVGRKPVIVGGLLVFILGSIVAAMAESMAMVVIGRALQGSGAIAAAVLALAADLTREEVRARVMAGIGATIALTFAVALVLGPVLDQWFGVPGIFWLTALLSFGAILIVVFAVPTAVVSLRRDVEVVPDLFGRILRDHELLRLDFGIFALHFTLAANFVVLPVLLDHDLGFAAALHWQIYLPVILGALAVAVPFIVLAERRRKLKELLTVAVALLALTQVFYIEAMTSLMATAIAVFGFFVAFNLLEATLPSLVAKLAPPERKGTAMGVYSTAQFLGVFAGGSLGGLVWQIHGVSGVFLLCGTVLLGWLLAATTMRTPRYLASRLLHVGPMDESEAIDLGARLVAVPGVIEANVVGSDGVAYLRVDSHSLDEAALREFSDRRP